MLTWWHTKAFVKLYYISFIFLPRDTVCLLLAEGHYGLRPKPYITSLIMTSGYSAVSHYSGILSSIDVCALGCDLSSASFTANPYNMRQTKTNLVLKINIKQKAPFYLSAHVWRRDERTPAAFGTFWENGPHCSTTGRSHVGLQAHAFTGNSNYATSCFSKLAIWIRAYSFSSLCTVVSLNLYKKKNEYICIKVTNTVLSLMLDYNNNYKSCTLYTVSCFFLTIYAILNFDLVFFLIL